MRTNGEIEMYARRFVFVLLNQRSRSGNVDYVDLTKNGGLKSVSDVLGLVGFKTASLALGELTALPKSGHGYARVLLNPNCPFRANNLDGTGQEEATMLLEDIFSAVSAWKDRQETKCTEDLVQEVASKIESFMPLPLIKLTLNGDYLSEEFPTNPRDHTKDSDPVKNFPYATGRHRPYCQGVLKVQETTEQVSVILCYICGLRVEFPKQVNTYGELREYFESKLVRELEKDVVTENAAPAVQFPAGVKNWRDLYRYMQEDPVPGAFCQD